MESTIVMETLDDADTLFLIAKDRLLDINEWSNKIHLNTVLTDKYGQKQHRNAHSGDLIKANVSPDQSNWLHIDNIVYDDYPDNNTEQITLSLSLTVPPSGNQEAIETRTTQEIIIRRINSHIHAIATESLNYSLIPQEYTIKLLNSLISIEEYEV